MKKKAKYLKDVDVKLTDETMEVNVMLFFLRKLCCEGRVSSQLHWPKSADNDFVYQSSGLFGWCRQVEAML